MWRHGDWVTFTDDGACVITGRSDATLNRGGVRLGTSDFYAVVEGFAEVADSLVVHLEDDDGGGLGRAACCSSRSRPAPTLDDDLRGRIRAALRTRAVAPPRARRDRGRAGRPPHAVGQEAGGAGEADPDRHPADVAASRDSLADPAALDWFVGRGRATMSVERIIAPRRRSIGAAEVDRLLPFHARRMVGPFIFADLIGPEELAPGRGADVPPHPHIGLATVTYLFDGALVHRDSTGAVQAIEPGGVNWMTAGSGVAHSERSPDDARPVTATLAGLQTWVALPDESEEVDAVVPARRRRATCRPSATAASRCACSSGRRSARRRRCRARRRCSTPTCTSTPAPASRCRPSTPSGPCSSSTATSRSPARPSRPATSPSSTTVTPSCGRRRRRAS